jgi:pyrroline-5-carboxylate reductase
MIGFIGGGNMAEALIKGMTSKGMKDIIVSEPLEEKRKHLENIYHIKTTADNKEAVKASGIIILAVKPQNMASVLDEIAGLIGGDKTIVSIAAGIKLSYLQEKLKTKKLIRVMPNTPCLVGEGMSVFSLCECFPDGDINKVREIFMSVGKVLTLPEKYMDAVTALSGSGPAFIAFFLEGMVEGAVSAGLNEDDALALASQTLLGTGRLLDEGMRPEKLMQMVTSPGGTTAEGLKVFEQKGLKGIVAEAVGAAVRRSKELGKA